VGGSAKAWFELLAVAKGGRVRVGVFDGEIAKIAMIHEYGAPRANIPERSFIRSTVAERKTEMQSVMARVVRALIAKQIDRTRALSLIGAWLQGAIKAQITVNGTFLPLAVATIRRKGSDKPLIDTGQLVNSITFVIVD
jgi:hypothetical protein